MTDPIYIRACWGPRGTAHAESALRCCCNDGVPAALWRLPGGGIVLVTDWTGKGDLPSFLPVDSVLLSARLSTAQSRIPID